MEVAPTDRVFARPVLAPMVATAVFVEFQATAVVMSWVELSV
jgi:hypothetical protein